jgi:hypothetical protein
VEKIMDLAVAWVAKERASKSGPAPLLPMPATYSEVEIAAKELPPREFVVDPLYVVGAHLISASPKIGKSWLIAGAGPAISTGEPFCGKFPTRKGPVLILNLEGNERRVKTRTAIIRCGTKPSADLHFAHDWPPMDSGGLDLREAKILKGKLAAVGIDVWGMFRSARPKNADPYQHDFDSARLISAIAQRTGCAIFVVRHNRKAAADDYTAEVNGTTELTAGFDSITTLTRKRCEADAVLKLTESR